jgi:2-desacetyl-2-hydroxyethyl bacteriochlorophyllide A dehydrogenase
MHALVYTAPGNVEWREWPDPQLKTGEVLVRVRAAAICGSDLHGFLGHSRIRIPPMVMGHEFAGDVLALGEHVEGIAVGDRVTAQPLVSCGHCRFCRNGSPNYCAERRLLGGQLQGAFAERIAVPHHLVYKLPDTLSYAQGAVVEPLANGVHMTRLDLPAYADVVIIGAGTLGLMALQAYRHAGARRVIVADTATDRLEVASRLGAYNTVNPATDDVMAEVRTLLHGDRPRIVVDAVGRSITRQQALEIVSPGGTVVLLGLIDAESSLDILNLINREVRVQGSYGSCDRDMRDAIALIADGHVDATTWVRHFTLEQGQEVFTRLIDSPAGLTKAIFLPGPHM